MSRGRHLRPTSNAAESGKEGMAVVLVVGLLSVLMLMAVAFSISMRIERRGAAGQRFGTQAEHILQTALSEAIYEIDSSLDSTNFHIYPPWQVLVSSTDETYSAEASVLSKEVLAYVPFSLETPFTNAVPYWRTIKGGGGDGDVLGRYAFVIINCSGLIDGNVAGGTNRVFGQDPREIDIGVLGDVANVEKFCEAREFHYRYETLEELSLWNYGLEDGKPSYLTAYSRAEQGQFLDPDDPERQGTDQTNIAGSVSDLQEPVRRQRIVDKLVSSGLVDDQSQATFVFDNLIDYIDTNSVPHDLAGAYTEAVPMLSEFRAKVDIFATNLAAGLSVDADLETEWHYPFVGGRGEKCFMDTELVITLENETQNTTASGAGQISVDSLYEFTDFVYYSPEDAATVRNVTIGIDTGDVITVTCEARGRMTIGGEIVDASPYPTNQLISLGSTNFTVTGSFEETVILGAEVFDPRFNWSATANQHWHEYHPVHGSSLRSTNYWTREYYEGVKETPLGSTLDHPGLDDQANGLIHSRAMQSWYVSDAGRLHSVGELGNLLRGGTEQYRFKTFHLYDKSADYMVDEGLRNLTLTNGMRRGLVNVNTEHTNVLEAVFVGAPVAYPGSPVTVSAEDAKLIVDYIMWPTLRNDYYTNLTDLGRLDRVDWVDLFPEMTDLERESIIAYSQGLLTVRQHLFLIVLQAQSFTLEMGGKAGSGRELSGSHAIAEVWRDPFRDEDGNHRYNIRYFKVLEQ